MTVETLTKTVPLTKHIVCFQKGFVHLSPTANESNLAYASTVQSRLMGYGYMLSPEAFGALRKQTKEDIISFHNEVIDYIQWLIGGKEDYTPLYGDFPLTVMSDRDANVIVQSIAYITASGDFTGFEPVMDKPIKFEKSSYTTLALGNQRDVEDIFTNIVSINTSLTPQDLEIVKWFVNSGLPLRYPKTIPFKENLCTLGSMMISGLPIGTTTDVLRIAVGMSGGDISLPKVPSPTMILGKSPYIYSTQKPRTASNPLRETFKFKKWTRSERRYILDLLESSNCDVREMRLKAQRWIKLAHGLHPGDYKERYPRAYTAIQLIRNNKVRSWYSELNDAFKKSLVHGLNLLVQRPGEFMRRMDWLIRKHDGNTLDTVEIINRFRIAVGGSSNKVLYEVYKHFAERNKPVTNRSIMIKGSRKRTKLPDLPAISEQAVDLVKQNIIAVLRSRFSKLDDLGKVWIDPELKKIPLPSNMRSLDLSLKPVIRGQRIPIGNQDAKVLRAYFHWFDKEGRLDPDLSATFAKDNSYPPKFVSYSSVMLGKSIHSGDVIARKGYCAEYIDIDIQDAIASGYRYVSLDVRNYRGGSLAEMDGVFGIMEREFPEANNTWVPSTVQISQRMSSRAPNTLAAIIDLHTMEYIFLDLDSSGITTATGDANTTISVIKRYCNPPEFGVYQLLELHGQARGTIVGNKDEADIAYIYDDFCHDYVKIGQFMGI